ncbi:ABC transporter ATP-binding protein [Clostridium sp. CF011]|uniref:ABC transporter ATP-binding protein n=1 Tax=Clostridium sp. CF011 TaxID=2843318 RepID=UPI001C0E7645|nr:ABC transporter ATP-binding protein [Clostridium sp. CF011]MBU3093528.1 ABC transporter ATP-binding protein [Clostridium sp. CF011]WAG71735.1 ABC transporter ATP-binding protein [Clostridium sp. CF011]
MMLEVKNLIVKYKGIVAVDNISFQVKEGEIFSIIGPNGAGKTSTIESIVGLKKNYEGNITVLGTEVRNFKKNIYNLIGVQLQEASFPDKLKVGEICDLFSSLYENPIDYKNLLEKFQMKKKVNCYIRELSGGQKQKLSIILALLPDPEIIFLDELTTGLDPQARRSIWTIIKNLKDKNKTIILSTHFMDEAEYLSDTICILIDGKIRSLGGLGDILLENNMEEKVSFNTSDDINLDFNNTISIKREGRTVKVWGRSGENLTTDILRYLNDNNIKYDNLICERPKLEDVFLKITDCRMEDI